MDKSAVIQCLWIGNKLGRMEELSVVSFLKNFHTVHLYAYQEIENLPQGVLLMDANKIIDESKIFKYKDSSSYAGFADLFRYKLLLEKGGFWVDSDMVCLAPFLTPDEYVFASERIRYTGIQVNNCVIGVPAGCGIMEFCYNSALSKDPNDLKWGVTGPKLLSEATSRFGLEEFVVSHDVFCPVNWWDVKNFISKPLSEMVTESTYGIHFYHQAWINRYIDKEDIFDENCSYEELFKLYSLTKR